MPLLKFMLLSLKNVAPSPPHVPVMLANVYSVNKETGGGNGPVLHADGESSGSHSPSVWCSLASESRRATHPSSPRRHRTCTTPY
eukprot:8452304-Pyramimonas_sp.AAC.1